MPAFADSDELHLEGVVMPEVAWLVNPASGQRLPFSDQGNIAFRPRCGLSARWGLTNALHVGLQLDAAAWPNLQTPSINLRDENDQRLTGTLFSNYYDVTMPLLATYVVHFGYDFAALLEIQGGPALAVWQNVALGDPDTLDSSGKPLTILPGALIPTGIYAGGTARVSVAFRARLFDLVVLSGGPVVGATWAGSTQLHAGVNLRASFVTPLGGY